MEILVSVSVVAIFVVSWGSSCGPGAASILCMFEVAVLIAVGAIVAVFGAIVCYLEPRVSFAVALFDAFVGSSLVVITVVTLTVAVVCSLGGACCNRLLKLVDCFLKCHLLFIRLVALFHEETI